LRKADGVIGIRRESTGIGRESTGIGREKGSLVTGIKIERRETETGIGSAIIEWTETETTATDIIAGGMRSIIGQRTDTNRREDTSMMMNIGVQVGRDVIEKGSETGTERATRRQRRIWIGKKKDLGWATLPHRLLILAGQNSRRYSRHLNVLADFYRLNRKLLDETG